MYAILAHGGKQYRATPGQTLKLERLSAGVGEQVEIPGVVLVSDGGQLQTGEQVARARVVATVLRQDRLAKLIVFKKKRCKQYRRTRGHRQHYTEVRVDRIDQGA